LDGRVDLERIAKIIEESGADIIGLNEVDCHFSRRSGDVNQAERLAKLLQMDYEFGASLTLPALVSSQQVRQYGNALLSRYPIIHEETHHFQPKWMKAEGRSVLEATIQYNQHLIDTFISHISLNPWFSWKLCAFIVNRAKMSESNGKKILILGDWNMRPHSINWKRLSSCFQDTWYEHHEANAYGSSGSIQRWFRRWPFRSHGSTFPSISPKLRLDYIFASHVFRVEKAEVFAKDIIASDHLPVRACLRLDE
jgi:endonuclease/exonuclease/phosphatase family metal-dependent hydrolase